MIPYDNGFLDILHAASNLSFGLLPVIETGRHLCAHPEPWSLFIPISSTMLSPFSPFHHTYTSSAGRRPLSRPSPFPHPRPNRNLPSATCNPLHKPSNPTTTRRESGEQRAPLPQYQRIQPPSGCYPWLPPRISCFDRCLCGKGESAVLGRGGWLGVASMGGWD